MLQQFIHQRVSAQAPKPHSSSVETRFNAVKPITSHTAEIAKAPGANRLCRAVFLRTGIEQHMAAETRLWPRPFRQSLLYAGAILPPAALVLLAAMLLFDRRVRKKTALHKRLRQGAFAISAVWLVDRFDGVEPGFDTAECGFGALRR